MRTDLVIERFEPDRAARAGFAAYHDVVKACQAADRPGEPTLPLEELIGRLKKPMPGMGRAVHWVGLRHRDVVAVAEVFLLDEENSDIAMVNVKVHPEHRRAGIGSALLCAILPELKAQERRVIEGGDVVAGTAGQLWADAVGFRQVRRVVRQALITATADRTRWDVPVPGGYRLEYWEGTAPENLIESYALARGAIRDAPLGDSGYRWPEYTVERVRAAEAELRSQSMLQRLVVAVHEASGAVAAFTELCVHPRRPDWGYQRDTAVVAEHRGNGLGRCVKAHMLRRLVTDAPEVRWISTTTGAENMHMIRVNDEVGYTTLPTLIAVQGELTAVEARLGAVRRSPAVRSRIDRPGNGSGDRQRGTSGRVADGS
ncbi:GNAT family N-acetyltransferase [Amycolatopsis sp. cmx-4-61]|uniref:GNAT family N-acetyltransferase n=1 Tax=Amycolatopsis sp. cmx-4-61 TaxID=2790937 RepID=UPI0039789AB6